MGTWYRRTTVGPRIIDRLKKADVNIECLEGVWERPEEEWRGYGELHTFEYPWKLPEKLSNASTSVQLVLERKPFLFKGRWSSPTVYD